MSELLEIATSSEDKNNDTIKVGKIADGVAEKFIAVWGQSSLLCPNLPNILSLYGLMKLSLEDEKYNRFIDREIGSFLFMGANNNVDLSCYLMGGVCGALKVIQGYYLKGNTDSGLLEEHIRQLSDEPLRSEDGSLLVKKNGKLYFCSEAVLGACSFLAAAAMATGKINIFEDAVKQYYLAEEKLINTATGLFTYTASPSCSLPCPAWSRANGHFAATLVELLRFKPNNYQQSNKLITSLNALLEKLVEFQTENGMWRMIIDDVSSPEETSGSALIFYSIVEGINNKWLSREKFLPIMEKAWNGLLNNIDMGYNWNIKNSYGEIHPEINDKSLELSLNDINVFGPLLMASAGYYGFLKRELWASTIESCYKFQATGNKESVAYFEMLHERIEHYYNKDGSWGDGTQSESDQVFKPKLKITKTSHPLIRDSAHCALGYLGAHKVSPSTLYERRAREGLDWLLKEQERDGHFKMYTRKKEGQSNHNGCLYVTGIAGCALIKGYEVFKDSRYLESSKAAADWEKNWAIVSNVNFNAFPVWHLAEHYRLTGKEEYLEAAIKKTKIGIISSQTLSGGWVGHNSWSWYHGINLRAYAALYRVLPINHGFRDELMTSIKAAIKYLVLLQNSDGAINGNPQSPETPTSGVYPISALALWNKTDDADQLTRNILYGAVNFRISDKSGDPEYAFNYERKDASFSVSLLADNLYAMGEFLECSALKP